MAIGDKYDGSIGQAVHLMQFYMHQVYEAAGLCWDSDNDAEMQIMVECIVNAAKREMAQAMDQGLTAAEHEAGALPLAEIEEQEELDSCLVQIAHLLTDCEALPTDEQDVADAVSIVQTVKNALENLDAEQMARVILGRKVRELEAQIAAVPVASIMAIVDGTPVDNWTRKPLAAVNRWLAGVGK